MISENTIQTAANALCENLHSNLQGSFKDEAALSLLAERDWSLADIGELNRLVVAKFIEKRGDFARIAHDAVLNDADVEVETLTQEDLESLIDARSEEIAKDLGVGMVLKFVDLMEKNFSKDIPF